MRIQIHDRLKPFSHIPGTVCLLPLTYTQFKIYPALIEVYDLQQERPKLINTIPLHLPGPVEQFTIQLDMEKGWIRVWGFSKGSFFRYRVISTISGEWGIFSENEFTKTLFAKDLFTKKEKEPIPFKERLSFGVHKAQEVEQIRKRGEINEFFPFWFRLGQLVPKIPKANGGVFDLLEECVSLMSKGQMDPFHTKIKQLFLVGFKGIFSPSLFDDDHLGFSLSKPIGSPLSIVQEGASLIRSLFFQEKEEMYLILPKILKGCHSGKITGITSKKATLDIEWTKNTLRRMVIFGEKEGQIRLVLPKEIKKFRFKEKGSNETAHLKGQDHLLSISHEKTYFFDRFET